MLCWGKDSSGYACSVKYAQMQADGANRRPAENPQFNQGFTTRKNILMDSNPRGSFSFIIPFSHMFGFADYNKVLYNLRQTLTLNRCSDDRLAIHRANGVPDGIVQLSEICWKVPIVVVEPKTRLELTKYIVDKKTFLIHYSGRYCNSKEIDAGSQQLLWTIPTQSGIEKPRWIFIGFQTDRHMTQEQNPAVFDNLSVVSGSVSLDEISYPTNGVRNNFAINDYAKLYEMMSSFKREHYGFNNLIGGTQINMYDFKKLFPILVVDVRKQKDQLTTGVANIHIAIDFNQAVPVPANTKAYVVILSDRLFKLQSDGKNLTVLRY